MSTKRITRAIRFLVFWLVPIILVASVNFYVDSYALLRTTYQDLAQQMSSGKNVTGVSESKYNERSLVLASIYEMKEAPQQIIIGSSRSFTIGAEQFPDAKSYHNFSVSGATIYDYYGIIGYLHHKGIMPERLMLEVNGSLFYDGDTDERHLDFIEGQNYLKAVMDGEAPQEMELTDVGRQYAKLLSLDYFQYNFTCLMDGERFDVKVTDGFENERSTRLSDGSVTYRQEDRERTVDYIQAETQKAIDNNSIYKIYGFTELSAERTQLFERLVLWLCEQGVEVSFYIPPYSQPVYECICENPMYSGVIRAEAYTLGFAAENGLAVYGSFSPEGTGLQFDETYDGFHIRREVISKTIYQR